MVVDIEICELIDDMMIEDIANMSLEELSLELSSSPEEVSSFSKDFSVIVSELSPIFKKAKIKQARLQLDESRQNKPTTRVSEYLAETGKDAKSLLIDMFVHNRLPDGMTVAFRDGKEISDEEAEHILENLISIGALENNDKES